MIARDIMTSDVRTVRPQTPAIDIANLLLKHNISAVPVVDDSDHLIGMVSEGDLVRRHEIGTEKRRPWWLDLFVAPETHAREYVNSHGLKAQEIMSHPVFCVDEKAELSEVADMLEGHGVKRAPVTREGKLIGIISRGDLVRAFAKAVPSSAPARASDQRIRAELTVKLKQQPWARSLYIQSQVHDGTVEFWGFAESDDQRRGLTVLAETIPGVKSVNNRLQLGMTLYAS